MNVFENYNSLKFQRIAYLSILLLVILLLCGFSMYKVALFFCVFFIIILHSFISGNKFFIEISAKEIRWSDDGKSEKAINLDQVDKYGFSHDCDLVLHTKLGGLYIPSVCFKGREAEMSASLQQLKIKSEENECNNGKKFPDF